VDIVHLSDFQKVPTFKFVNPKENKNSEVCLFRFDLLRPIYNVHGAQ